MSGVGFVDELLSSDANGVLIVAVTFGCVRRITSPDRVEALEVIICVAFVRE